MQNQICGLLIASGFSGRMNGLKALLDIGGASFITGIVIKLSLVCDKVIVVLGHEKKILETHLIDELTNMSRSAYEPLKFSSKKAIAVMEIIYNGRYDEGMFSSLQAGIDKAQNCPWVFYHFIDQPALPKSFYYELTRQRAEKYDWIQPVYGEQPGHPLLMSRSLYDTITNTAPGNNLRNILITKKEKRLLWRCIYPEILDDIDTKEEYEKVKLRGYNLIEDLRK